MNEQMLEAAAEALGDVVDDVMFVGGASIELWLTDPAAAPPQVTIDVDVVVEVASRPEMNRFEERLRAQGFNFDQDSGLTCRWIHSKSGLTLDAMPTDESVLGFASVWQAAAIGSSELVALPSGRMIRCATPPYLVAMKLEAFNSRGNRDFLGSKDFSDLIALIDGRPELVIEIAKSNVNLRHFISSNLAKLRSPLSERGLPSFKIGLYGAMPPNATSQSRVDLVLLTRIDQIIALK